MKIGNISPLIFLDVHHVAVDRDSMIRIQKMRSCYPCLVSPYSRLGEPRLQSRHDSVFGSSCAGSHSRDPERGL